MTSACPPFEYCVRAGTGHTPTSRLRLHPSSAQHLISLPTIRPLAGPARSMHLAGSWVDPLGLQRKRPGCRQQFGGPASLLFDLEVSDGPGPARMQGHVVEMPATRDRREIPSCPTEARVRRAPRKVPARNLGVCTACGGAQWWLSGPGTASLPEILQLPNIVTLMPACMLCQGI